MTWELQNRSSHYCLVSCGFTFSVQNARTVDMCKWIRAHGHTNTHTHTYTERHVTFSIYAATLMAHRINPERVIIKKGVMGMLLIPAYYKPISLSSNHTFTNPTAPLDTATFPQQNSSITHVQSLYCTYNWQTENIGRKTELRLTDCLYALHCSHGQHRL